MSKNYPAAGLQSVGGLKGKLSGPKRGVPAQKTGRPISDDVVEATPSPPSPSVDEQLAAMEAADAEKAQVEAEAKSTAAPPEPTPAPTKAPPSLSPLGLWYLAVAVGSFRKLPSPALSPGFFAFLQKVREMLTDVGKVVKSEGEQLVFVLQALAAGRKVDAMRLLRSVGDQVLWQATLDIQRARRQAEAGERGSRFGAVTEALGAYGDGDDPSRPRGAPLGLEGAASNVDTISGFVGPQERQVTTESQALAALIEVNGWLGVVADVLCVDEAERVFFRLEKGLEFTTVEVATKHSALGTRTWEPVYDAEMAVDAQIVKNQLAMRRRNEREMSAKSTQFDALRALVAGAKTSA